MNRNRGPQNPIPNPARLFNPVPWIKFSTCLVPYQSATILTSSLLFALPNLLPHAARVHTPIRTYDGTLYWVNMTGISICDTDFAIFITSFKCDASKGKSGVVFDSATQMWVRSNGSIHLIDPKSRLLPLNPDSVAAHSTSIVHTLSSSF